MSVPDHVWKYWQHTDMTKEQVLEAHKLGFISFKTEAEIRAELEAIIKERD